MNNAAFIEQLKQKGFSIADGKALLQAPGIMVRVHAENADIQCPASVQSALEGCVLSKSLQETASHCFQRFGGFRTEKMKEFYALFDIYVEQDLFVIDQSQMVALKTKLHGVAPYFD